jgi:hypothetical protein
MTLASLVNAPRNGSSWEALIIDQISLVWTYLLYQYLEYALSSFLLGEVAMLGIK